MPKLGSSAFVTALATTILVSIGLSNYSPAGIAAAGNGLLAPSSGGTEHSVSSGVAWHGCLLVLSWVILMPMGFVVARFYKITPAQDWPRQLDNPFWFVGHRMLGYFIGILTTLGLALVLWDRRWIVLWQDRHVIAGWAVFALGWFQIVGSLCRGTHGGPMDSFTRQPRPPEEWPGDHFSMTKRRVFFEYSHKLVGYVLVPLSSWTIYSGLDAVDAPRWMYIAIGLWALACLGVCVHLQRAGKCIDTYQAIWGLDTTLPGYRRQPIGLGIRRVIPPSKIVADDGRCELMDE